MISLDQVLLLQEKVESAVEKRFSDGDITAEELDSITKTSTSYAVTVKEKEVVPDVQQSYAVAKKKPVLKKK